MGLEIAAITGIVSATAAVGQGVVGAGQAAGLRKQGKKASRVAARQIADSKRGTTRNVQEEARIRTFALEEAQRRQSALASEAAQALQATGARGVLSGIQGVQTQATEAMLGITASMELKEQQREEAILKQEQANIDALREINLAEAEGATAAAAAAQTARAKAISSSLQGFGAAAAKATDLAALYSQTRSEKLGADVFSTFGKDPASMKAILGENYQAMYPTEIDRLKAVQALSPEQLRGFRNLGRSGLSASTASVGGGEYYGPFGTGLLPINY